jgi:hypothetical protein
VSMSVSGSHSPDQHTHRQSACALLVGLAPFLCADTLQPHTSALLSLSMSKLCLQIDACAAQMQVCEGNKCMSVYEHGVSLCECA